MNIDVLEKNDTVNVLEFSGSLDTEGATAIQTDFNHYVVDPKINTIIDISKMDYISSLGIGMLIRGCQALAQDNKKLILAAPTAQIKKVFISMNVNTVLILSPSIKIAKLSLS